MLVDYATFCQTQYAVQRAKINYQPTWLNKYPIRNRACFALWRDFTAAVSHVVYIKVRTKQNFSYLCRRVRLCRPPLIIVFCATLPYRNFRVDPVKSTQSESSWFLLSPDICIPIRGAKRPVFGLCLQFVGEVA